MFVVPLSGGKAVSTGTTSSSEMPSMLGLRICSPYLESVPPDLPILVWLEAAADSISWETRGFFA